MGFRDYVVEQAAAAEDRAADLSAKQDAWRDRRATAIVADLETRPMLACMTACYSPERNPPVGVELVAWVMATSADPDRTLAEMIYSVTARHRLHRVFAAAAAEHECDQRPESAWEA